jgi:hypothetical protein
MSQREPGPDGPDDDLATFKEYLSDPRFRIRLDDQVNAAVGSALVETSVEKLPFEIARANGGEFTARLAAYEAAIKPLQTKAVLLGKWASSEQLQTLTSMLARMADAVAGAEIGHSLWMDLGRYPLSLLLYAVGIASLAAEKYRAFAAAHSKRIDARTLRSENRCVNIVVPVVDAMQAVARTGAWRQIEEYQRMHVPESEHLFRILRPALDKLLFLGSRYERLFDRYEVLRALIYADVTDSGRGPAGRFGWKYSGGRENPFTELRGEAAQEKDAWGPLWVGLFGGSHERFEQTAAKYEKELLSRLEWH